MRNQLDKPEQNSDASRQRILNKQQSLSLQGHAFSFSNCWQLLGHLHLIAANSERGSFVHAVLPSSCFCLGRAYLDWKTLFVFKTTTVTTYGRSYSKSLYYCKRWEEYMAGKLPYRQLIQTDMLFMCVNTSPTHSVRWGVIQFGEYVFTALW